MTPVLVACAHGTRSPAGRRLMAELALAARELRPGLDTTAAFVDVQPPTVADVVAGLAAEGRRAVVVPLLLSGGYHVHVDIADAVRGSAGVVAARPLGPDPRLVEVLTDRLLAAGADPADPGRPSCWPRPAPATRGRSPTSRAPQPSSSVPGQAR